MKTRHQQRQYTNAMRGVMALFGTFAAAGFLFWALPTFFSYVDCNTARDYIAFVEACDATNTCTVRDFERGRVEGYYRLELKRCKKESEE